MAQYAVKIGEVRVVSCRPVTKEEIERAIEMLVVYVPDADGKEIKVEFNAGR